MEHVYVLAHTLVMLVPIVHLHVMNHVLLVMDRRLMHVIPVQQVMSTWETFVRNVPHSVNLVNYILISVVNVI